MREPVYFGVKRRHFAAEGARENEWMGKRVLIVGMARSGIAAAQLLHKAGAVVTVNDGKAEDAFGDKLDVLRGLGLSFRLGENGLDALENQDVLLISPGVPIDAPIVEKARKMQIPVLGEMEMAARFIPCDMVALTGTNGKTTTVSLLGAIFREAGKICYVAGNIGYPLSSAAVLARKEDMVVVEVSSFQLETTTSFHPLSAAVLNVTEDHLNRHGTMDVYTGLKKHIFDAQTEKDFAVLNYEDDACREMGDELNSRVLYFSRIHEVPEGTFVRDGQIIWRMDGEEKIICRADEVKIPGPHNLENALAATAIAMSRGVPGAVIRHALRTFAGVEHRIEFTRELDGVRYINDSKGTNTDSTIKAVQSMQADTVMILGGYDKHVSFAPLAEEIARTPLIRHCVLIGETAMQIEKALSDAGYVHFSHAKTLKDAVQMCHDMAESGYNVLFSPACASFDMFEDFEQRGRIFKQLVQQL